MKRDIAKVVLEWAYEPKNFFEEPVMRAHKLGTLKIEDGKVLGEFVSNVDDDRQFCHEMHTFLNTTFLLQQVLVHRKFELSHASMSGEYADGKKFQVAFAQSLSVNVMVGCADIKQVDAQGNVLVDTRAERISSQSEFREKAESLAMEDPTLKRMLHSFNQAIEEAENLFVYLYEIRDAVSTEFASGKATSALRIDPIKWKRFGLLTNREPVQESRHRGKHDAPRAATEKEKEFVIGFAQELIEAYVDYRKREPGS